MTLKFQTNVRFSAYGFSKWLFFPHECFRKIEQENGVAVDKAERTFEKARADNIAVEHEMNAVMEPAKVAAGDVQFYLGVGAFVPLVNIVTLPMYATAREKSDEAVNITEQRCFV